MPTAKKQPTKRKPKAEVDSDSDEPEVEEEEQVESDFARRKREQGRSAFLRSLRKLLGLVPLVMVLSQQPFVIKPRAPGVNRGKVVPLQLAIAGAVHWAKESPTTLRNPNIAVHMNTTARVLLTPFEYFKARESKRAMPAEKTMTGAFRKTEKTLQRVSGDSETKTILSQPMPNIALIGAALITLCSLLTPLVAGAEYGVIAGCGALVQATRSLGMEPQPELYVTGVVAVLCCVLLDSAKPSSKDKAAKRKRK